MLCHFRIEVETKERDYQDLIVYEDTSDEEDEAYQLDPVEGLYDNSEHRHKDEETPNEDISDVFDGTALCGRSILGDVKSTRVHANEIRDDYKNPC